MDHNVSLCHFDFERFLSEITHQRGDFGEIKCCDTSVYICHLKLGMEMHREIIVRTMSLEIPMVKGLCMRRLPQMRQKWK